MAFASAQLSRLRSLLGYPDLHRYRNTRLEAAFAVVGADAAAQAAVEAIVAEIDDFDAKLVASSSVIQSAGLKRAEDVEWYPSGMKGNSSGLTAPMLAIIDQGRIRIGRISTLFGVPVYADYYGRYGYPGDSFMSAANQRGMGGMFGLG